MSIFKQAREYERKYHEELYGNHELFEPGTWLHRPASYAVKSFELISKHSGVRALDLGAGVGRHSIPLAQHFGPAAEVICVDLLDTAIGCLMVNAKKQGVGDAITGVVEDVATFDLGGKPYDLVLSISCIEHVPTKLQLKELIRRLQKSTAIGGVHCFMMITDNEWIDSKSGKTLVPLIEQNLSATETSAMLYELYTRWHIHDVSTKTWQAEQVMNGRKMVLKSACVQFTAQK